MSPEGRSMKVGQAALIAGILSFGLAAGTIHLTSDGRDIAAVWPANAVLLAVLLIVSPAVPPDRRPGAWAAVLAAGYVANVAANMLTRGLSAGPFLLGVCNLVEICVAAHLLRPASNGEGLLGARRVVGRFILVCGLAAPAISGLGGAATAWALFGQDLGRAFAAWVASDSLGLLIFTPFFFALLRGDYGRCLSNKDWRQRAEAAGLQMLTAAAACGVFFVAARPLLFALFGPVMLATFRVGRLGAEASVMIVAVVGTVATLRGQGPIAMVTPDPREQALLFQAFLAGLLLTCLPVAAALTAREEALAALARSAEALRVQGAELAHRAAIDDLTGALNRAAFRECSLLAMRNAAGQGPDGPPLSLIAIDLDLFKAVNDRHGHRAGDRALVHLVAILRAGLRGPDAIGRVGGDEFLVLLPGTDLDRAGAIAARLREALRRTPLTLDDGTVLTLSMSCGAASYRDGMGFEDFVHAADTALYRAKRAGREVAQSA
ncbi:diguanylate cyclase [Methylobacterium sp. DB0501]|nr:diguanylate cyclase [Methylobacterium sp. DB0501]